MSERRTRLEQPFRGITTNGDVVPDLYTLADENAQAGAMVEAARHSALRRHGALPRQERGPQPRLYL